MDADIPSFASAQSPLLETLLNISLTGVIVFEPAYSQLDPSEIMDLAYQYLNPAAQRMLGLPECPLDSFLTLYPHTIETGIFAFYRDTFLSGQPASYRVNYSYDGLDNYFLLAAQRSGSVLVVSFTDTAEQDRSQVEADLRQSQAREQRARSEAQQDVARLERLLLQAPVAIAIFKGPTFRIELANPKVLSLWGRSAQQALHTPLFELLPEIAGQGVEELLAGVMRTGEPYVASELPTPIDRYGRRDTVYWNFVYQPWRDEGGDITGVMVIATEVTEQVLARQQVQSLNEEMMAGNEELRATNEELSEARHTMEQFIAQLDERVQERTRELTLAQAEVFRQRERLERFFQQAPAGICVLDGPELTFELINPGYQAFFPGRVLLGKPVHQALPEIVGAPISDILTGVYRTGETFYGREVPVWLARYEGAAPEELFFNFIYQARRDENGQVDGILVFVYEVTEAVLSRKKAEQSALRFQMLTEALPQLVWTATPDGNLDYFSAHWWSYSGLSYQESKGQGWTSTIHSEDLPHLIQHWMHCLQTGNPYGVEARLRRADGVYCWFLIRARALQSEGRITQWVGTCTDLDEQKRTESELQQLSQQLAQTNDELTVANEEIRASNEELSGVNERLVRINADLDNFIYAASHDLKAPISNIEGLMTVLKRNLPSESLQNERVAKPLSLIETSIARFKRTIGDLTSITQLQRESNQDLSQVPLAETVEEVRQDLETLLTETGGQLRMEIGACPTLLFSRKNLRSVVYNLLSNALKYRSSDRVPVIRMQCGAIPGYTMLTVTDNGLGMDLSRENKIFTMFGRLHDHVEGSGVGLYMVKKMVENVGGRIEVESQVGQGSTFRVYFPA